MHIHKGHPEKYLTLELENVLDDKVLDEKVKTYVWGDLEKQK